MWRLVQDQGMKVLEIWLGCKTVFKKQWEPQKEIYEGSFFPWPMLGFYVFLKSNKRRTYSEMKRRKKASL